jgi:uncharacterized protein (DUF608 family)
MNKFQLAAACLTTVLLPRVCALAAPAPKFDASTGTIIDKRWKSGLPLGGIGNGKIELMTDGSFGNFTNQSNWDRPYPWAKGAFAAIRVQSTAAAPVARILRLQSEGEYAGVDNIAHTKMQGWFPRAHIDYSDPALPVKVTLDAFSPLIPHDIRDSSMPVAYLNYTLSNPSKAPEHVTFAFSWPNLLGWGGRGGVAWNDLSGDQQSAADDGKITGLQYTTTQSYADQQQNVVGEDYVGLRKAAGLTISTNVLWDSAAATPSFWQAFVSSGDISSSDQTSTQPAGLVSAALTLQPGETRKLHYYVVWAMPSLVMVDQERTYSSDRNASPAVIPAITNNTEQRWTTNRGMAAGDQLVLDLGKPYMPTDLMINSGKANSDYPRGLKVEVSEDGAVWTTVAQKTSDEMFTTGKVELDGSDGRYIRLTNLGSVDGLFWSIYGLAVVVKEQSAPIEPVSATSYLVHSEESTISANAGHYWQNWWSDDLQMAAYADANADQFLQETRSWQDPVLQSNVPFWLKLKLINCAFPMFSNTVFTKAGQFSVLESPIDMGGALGTMDQRMAAHAFLTAFFPELDRTELEQYATCQQSDGRITHFDGNVHQAIVNPNVGYGITDWPDLSCGWVSQVVKLYRWTGDLSFLDRMRPHIDSAMSWLQKDGADDDLIPAGGSTYDYETLPRGAFIYSASCYLGALRAAAAVAGPKGAAAYSQLTKSVQASVMRDLWTGTYFRKWKQPSTGRSVDDSFVSNLAGDWFTRITGLPSTLNQNIVHQSLTQTIGRNQKPFFPIPPMQVTAAGRATTSNCYTLQHEPYLGCEAIYGNFVDDGLDTIRRVYFAVWEENESPWDESLCYDAPSGQKGGLVTYMTCPTTWFVLDALGGTTIDVPGQRLYISPRLTSQQYELHIPVYFSRFWAWLDYVPAKHVLTLKVTRVFPDDSVQQETLYHAAGLSGDVQPATITIKSIAADGNAKPITLASPFTVRNGAVLDLSSYIGHLAIPSHSEVVNFEVKAKVDRPGLPSDNWKFIDNLHDNPEVAALFGAAALDGNPDTRWTTGRPLHAGDAFTLDMASPHSVGRLVLDSAKSPGDFPAGYTLESSIDGHKWFMLARATEDETRAAVQGGVLTIKFVPVTARYLRVTSSGSHDLYWSVHELYVYGE